MPLKCTVQSFTFLDAFSILYALLNHEQTIFGDKCTKFPRTKPCMFFTATFLLFISFTHCSLKFCFYRTSVKIIHVYY